MRNLLPIVVVPFLLACPQPPGSLGVTEDLTSAAHTPAPRIPLLPVSLETQADYDALEQRFARTQAKPEGLIAALSDLAIDVDPSATDRDALLLMRLAVLYARHDDRSKREQGTSYLDEALSLGKRLQSAAPQNAHTLFLQGYIPWVFVGGTSRRPLIVTHDTEEFATACRDQWQNLLKAYPDYEGPKGYDNARIKRIIEELGEAISNLH